MTLQVRVRGCLQQQHKEVFEAHTHTYIYTRRSSHGSQQPQHSSSRSWRGGHGGGLRSVCRACLHWACVVLDVGGAACVCACTVGSLKFVCCAVCCAADCVKHWHGFSDELFKEVSNRQGFVEGERGRGRARGVGGA